MMCYNNAVKGTLLHACSIIRVSFRFFMHAKRERNMVLPA